MLTCSYMICGVKWVGGFLCLTLLDFAYFVYRMEWVHPVKLLLYYFYRKNLFFVLLIQSAVSAVRERGACEERLDKHKRSLRLVAGDLVACSSHGYQAEVSLVLHDVATNLSSTLISQD